MSQATFRATDNVRVTDHAARRWRERGFDGREPDYPADDAWRLSRDHAVPWGTHNATFARYHPPTDLILVAQRVHGRDGAQLKLITCRRARFDLGRKAVRQVVREAVAEVGGASIGGVTGGLSV